MLVVALSSGTAAADDACADAFSQAPKHVKAGRYIQGRDALMICQADPCPSSMRALCAADLQKLEDRIPTIVLVAKDANGKDLADVKVSDDARVLAEKMDGRSIPMDPGSHALKFERAGSDPVVVNVVIREGDRARAIEAKLVVKAAEAPPAAVQPVPTPPPKRDVETRPISWPVYMMGGLTVLGAAGWGIFGFRGISQRSDLESCKGTCDHDSVSKAKTSFFIADVSMIAGAVFLVTTGVFYVTRPTVHEEQ
jgi:hypothetical protein